MVLNNIILCFVFFWCMFMTWVMHMWPIHMCDMTHKFVWHHPHVCVTWPIFSCDVTRSYVWHDCFICVLIRLTHVRFVDQNLFCNVICSGQTLWKLKAATETCRVFAIQACLPQIFFHSHYAVSCKSFGAPLALAQTMTLPTGQPRSDSLEIIVRVSFLRSCVLPSFVCPSFVRVSRSRKFLLSFVLDIIVCPSFLRSRGPRTSLTRRSRFMSHVWMRHVTHVSVSCHVYICVPACYVKHMNESCLTCKWFMSSWIWMSNASHINASRRTYECVISHTGISYVTHGMCHSSHMNQSCHTVDIPCSSKSPWHGWVLSLLCMRHVTHMNAWCYTFWMNHATHVNVSCWTLQWVMSHIAWVTLDTSIKFTHPEFY